MKTLLLPLRWVLLEYSSFDQFPNKPRNQIFCPLNSSAWYDEKFFCLPKTLEQFHKSCLVTRKVYYIVTNSLSAIFFFLTAGQFGYGLNNPNSSQEHSAIIVASFAINWCFLSLNLKEILKMAANHDFNISTLNEPSFCV